MAQAEFLLTSRLRLVRSLPTMPRLAALVAGLDQAVQAESDPIAIELIELAIMPEPPRSLVQRLWARDAAARADLALQHLIARWDSLSDEVRLTAHTVGSGRWAAQAHRALDDPPRDPPMPEPERVKRSIALLAQHARDPALLELCVALLADPHEPVADEAERAILAMTLPPGVDPASLRPEFSLPAVGLMPEPKADERGDRVLIEQVCRAVASFTEHRRRGVLLAALLLLARPRPDRAPAAMDRLVALIHDDDQPAGAIAKSVLRLSRSPITRTIALQLLTDPALAGAARPRLGRSHTLDDHRCVLTASHLLLVPGRAAQLAPVRVAVRSVRASETSDRPTRALTPGGLMPTGAEYDALPACARSGLIRLASAVSLSPADRTAACEPMIDDPSARIRHACARAGPGALQGDLMLDRDPRVAQTAGLGWSLVGTRRWLDTALGPGAAARAQHVEHTGRNPHPAVRALGRDELGRVSPWDPEHAASRLIARRILERAPQALIEAMRLRLTRPPSAEPTIRLAVWLGIESRFEAELIEMTRAGSNDPASAKAAASAATALGRLASPESVRALMVCLSHTNPRVRANAVTALHHPARPATDAIDEQARQTMLVELKDSSHHRVRANALRALLAHRADPVDAQTRDQAGWAVAGVLAMLSDDRPEHRSAGVWLAERCLDESVWPRIEQHSAAIAARLSDLLDPDQPDVIRRRSTRCVRRLSARTRSGWSRTTLPDDLRHMTEPTP